MSSDIIKMCCLLEHYIMINYPCCVIVREIDKNH